MACRNIVYFAWTIQARSYSDLRKSNSRTIRMPSTMPAKPLTARRLRFGTGHGESQRSDQRTLGSRESEEISVVLHISRNGPARQRLYLRHRFDNGPSCF